MAAKSVASKKKAAKRKATGSGKAYKGSGSAKVTKNRMVGDWVTNALMTRQALIGSLIDSKRDIDEECGYPSVVHTSDYRFMYDREGIAARVVSLYPAESWQTPPVIYENEYPEETEFEKQVNEIVNKFNLWSYLERVDELSGISRYGVLLLGFDDLNQGEDLTKPVEKAEGRKLLFMRPFDESVVKISKFDGDVTSERYGLPDEYKISLLDASARATEVEEYSKKDILVHWTRVIHVADNRQDSEVFGVPRMKQVFNRLYDLRKLLGGAPEMFWKGAFPGFSFEVNPDMIDAELDKTALQDEFEKYSNGLQRYLAVQGLSVKSLSPQVAQPEGHFTVLMKAIAISLGVPWRILLGTEESKLAGSQDQVNWNRRVAKRRENYLSPFLIRPLIDRLQIVGVLPDVEYSIHWEDLNTVSDIEKAKIATEKTKAFAQYLTSQIDPLIPPLEFFTMVMGMSLEESKAILEAAHQAMEAGEKVAEASLRSSESDDSGSDEGFDQNSEESDEE